MSHQEHRAGFVNILGKPNVGKSTLMNAFLGEKLSIITSKAQTTRHRINGILNGDNYQVVFSDTPGILDPKYKLQENMLKASRSALVDADIILFVSEAGETPGEDYPFIESLKKTKTPVIIVVNKIDLANQERLEGLHKIWTGLLPKASFLPVSALENFNVDVLFNMIMEKLPLSPPYYPKEDISDKSERFFTAEIIRERILVNYKQEIPYSVEIEIEEFFEEESIIRIQAVIYVERDSQKAILIGKGGSSLKKTGTDARLELERFFNKKIFISLFVKVKKNWRNNEKFLKGFGYR